MKELILIRGVPGSGKSTLALDMCEGDRSAGMSSTVLEADQFMVDDFGNYHFDGSRLAKCHQSCQQFVNLHMTAGTERIYVSNTFIRRWEADVYHTLAKLWGYKVTVYRMTTEYGSVHGVPSEKINAMRDSMEPYDGEVFK
jgi:predicted kinase